VKHQPQLVYVNTAMQKEIRWYASNQATAEIPKSCGFYSDNNFFEAYINILRLMKSAKSANGLKRTIIVQNISQRSSEASP